MKTTLDLPDDLLIEAKAVAARRRTTLKDMVTHALRREIMPASELPDELKDSCEVNDLGLWVLKKQGAPTTAEEIQHLIDHQYDEEDARVMKIAGYR